MTAKTIVPAIVAILLLVFVLGSSRYYQTKMEQGLPEKEILVSQDAAKAAAGPSSFAVLGTGSMSPLLPSPKPGQDPWKTVVGYARTSRIPYPEIKQGNLCIYIVMEPWARNGFVMHQAIQKDRGGWIMSGLNNPYSESWARMAEANYIGVVNKVYTWPQ